MGSVVVHKIEEEEHAFLAILSIESISWSCHKVAFKSVI